ALRRGVQQWAALSQLQAVTLLPQLAKLDARNAQRISSVRKLRDLLTGLDGLKSFENHCECQPSYYKVGFQFDDRVVGLWRERFCQAARAEGIAMDAGFRAAHIGRAPERFRSAAELREAERAHYGCVILHHPVLLCNEAEVEAVARGIRRIYANARQ